MTLILILVMVSLKTFNSSKLRIKPKQLRPLSKWKLQITEVQPLHNSQINYDEKNSVVSLSR